jgi:predicted small lipoprotein YifL
MMLAVSEPLMRPNLPIWRALAFGALLLALAACGRRGALEAPPDASAAPVRAVGARDTITTRSGRAPEGQTNAPGQAQVEDDGEALDDAVVPSVVPTPPRAGGRKRGYVIPKDPFILDPLL